ncbi:MAG: DUF4416 family protein [Thermodesulfobacteria bacterium]|nr:DUF4416 family protein [Thermodesulfobacteriota bacterium]
MSKPCIPEPVVFFLAITGKDQSLWEVALKEVALHLGNVVFSSKVYDFSSFTSYYEKEMGKNLKKALFFFEKLMPPEFLIDLKHICYEIENRFKVNDCRRINIDPGYLNLSKLVLSTFKDFSHRIYLGRSVFAEVTLRFKKGKFEPLEWTYPDYSQPEILEFLQKVRLWYKERLRGAN